MRYHMGEVSVQGYYANHDKLCFKIGLKSKTIFKCYYKLTGNTDNKGLCFQIIHKSQCLPLKSSLYRVVAFARLRQGMPGWPLCIIVYCELACFVRFSQRSWLPYFINKIETKRSPKTLYTLRRPIVVHFIKHVDYKIGLQLPISSSGIRSNKSYLIRADIVSKPLSKSASFEI